MFFEFPFEYAQIVGVGRLFYPIVQLELQTVRGWQKFEFLVDTGADITTVPSNLLPVLGLNKATLPISNTLGVGGYSIKTWEFQLPLRFGRSEFKVKASAVETKNNSIPLLLGRKDIFEEKYNLLLDSKRKVTVISANSL